MRTEITLFWHADTVDIRRLDTVERFSIGTAPTDDLFVPLTGFASHVLLARGPDARVWFFPVDGAARPLDERTDEELSIGAFTLRVRACRPEPFVPFLAVFDTFFANISTGTLATTAAIVAAMVLAPAPAIAADDPLPVRQLATWFKPMMKKLPELLSPQAPRTSTDLPAPLRSKRTDGAARRGIDAGAIDALFSEARTGAGPSGTLLAALEAVGPGGTRIAGLTTKTGPGGVDTGTIEIGGITHKGPRHDLGAGDCGPPGSPCLKKKVDYTVAIPEQQPEVHGPLDKELIRRVVRDHMDQVRYCYEAELQQNPGLTGKVSLEWMIGPSGVVTAARTVDSSLPKAVSSCLEGKVLSWKFFKLPPGMGAAAIRYPFIFQRAG